MAENSPDTKVSSNGTPTERADAALQQNSNRRNVLKKLGATAVGVGVASGTALATTTVGGRDIKVRIDPARWSDWDEANNEVYDALDGFLTHLENRGAIPGSDITVGSPVAGYDGLEDPGRDYDPCSPTSLYHDPNGWQDHDNVANDTDHDVRLYVTDNCIYGGGKDEHAWDDTAARVWVGTADYDHNTTDITGRIKNATMQEVGHALIDYDCIADPMSANDPHDMEHALGRIYNDGTASPMIVFYENGQNPCSGRDLSGKKPCRGTARWNGTYDQSVTNCTVNAIKKSFCKHWPSSNCHDLVPPC